jgi:hypothetical protein
MKTWIVEINVKVIKDSMFLCFVLKEILCDRLSRSVLPRDRGLCLHGAAPIPAVLAQAGTRVFESYFSQG